MREINKPGMTLLRGAQAVWPRTACKRVRTKSASAVANCKLESMACHRKAGSAWSLLVGIRRPRWNLGRGLGAGSSVGRSAVQPELPHFAWGSSLKPKVFASGTGERVGFVVGSLVPKIQR